MNIEWFVIGAGAVVLLYIFYRIVLVFFNILGPYVFFRPIDLKKKAGASWAIVTGATDGIGKSYCFELARRGFNIYLVSRTESKLVQTKKDILAKHPNVQIHYATFDFTNPSSTGYKELLSQLNEVNIGILINNVGMFFEYPDYIHQMGGGLEKLVDVAIVNMLPPTLKYVSWLTATLRKEYGHQGILFQTITPFIVATKMAGNPNTSFFYPDSDSFAKSALNTIGNSNDTTGYIAHQLQYEMMNLMPEFLFDRAVLKTSAELKERALKNREETSLP
ncbi:hypothetical protein CAEBREN_19665 [Caenorhabditis brenneri]|uniref:Uncharacterized protein n=1 Tax=Caenorhabditis brenneri TaxID=135651 RepID=G0MRJ9_CAEBE|nr:hypothetical protein CAEBREN_19665 [Caenorhabditis brenneri]